MPRRSGVRFNTEQVSARLEKFDERANNGIAAAFEFVAPKSAARMKTEASWTDRTGNARNGLFTATEHRGNHHSMVLSHGVSYGIYLEARNSGRYAIIRPEIPRAAADVQRLINKILATMPKG